MRNAIETVTDKNMKNANEHTTYMRNNTSGCTLENLNGTQHGVKTTDFLIRPRETNKYDPKIHSSPWTSYSP